MRRTQGLPALALEAMDRDRCEVLCVCITQSNKRKITLQNLAADLAQALRKERLIDGRDQLMPDTRQPGEYQRLLPKRVLRHLSLQRDARQMRRALHQLLLLGAR